MTQAEADDNKIKSPVVPLEKDDGILKENKQSINSIVRDGAKQEIAKQVVRKKLGKFRHLVIKKAIDPEYLDSLFPTLLDLFKPQTVTVCVLCECNVIVILVRSHSSSVVQWRRCKH